MQRQERLGPAEGLKVSQPSDRGARRPRADPATLRALVRLASLVTASTGEGSLIEAVAETALELLSADSLSVSKLEPNGRVITTIINVGDLGPGEVRWPVDERYEIEDFPETLAFLLGQTMRRWATHVDDPGSEPAEVALLRSLDKASSLKTPISVGGRVWGELWAARGHATDPFDDGDYDLANVIAALVSAGLVQASAWQAIQAQAATDPMTGLANRRAFDEHFAVQLLATQAEGRPLALVVGDLNGLKRCNDTRGHAAGDDALLDAAGAAAALVAEVPDALAARLGGDEFVLVLPRLAADEAMAVARTWCDRSRHDDHGTSLSCGVAVATGQDPVDPRDLMRSADTALYAAKVLRGTEPVLAAP